MNEAPADAAKIFARIIEIPPGAPWDQYRAARLDAAHRAPLAAGEVAFVLKRLDAWRPRAPARYGVAYRRRGASDAADIEDVVLDGRTVRFRFRSARPRDLRGVLPTLAVAALAALALAGAGLKALEARAVKAEALTRLEANAAVAARLDRRRRQAEAEAALIRRADGEGRGIADLVADLWWLGQARAPEVILRKIEWTREAMVVEGVGDRRLVAGAERPVQLTSDSRGAKTWRVGSPPPPVVRNGVVRPSIVSSAPAPSGKGG